MTADLLPIIGFDPGISGAWACISDDGHSTGHMPTLGKEIHAAELARLIQQYQPKSAIIEQVSAMPGQGVASMFNFGRSYGVILGILAALEIPCVRVTPSQWKKFYQLTGKDKDASRALAVRLYPGLTFPLKKDHNRAEALLLARFLQESGKLI